MAARPEELCEQNFYAWTRDPARALRRLAATRPNLALHFRPAPVLSANKRLIRGCVGGSTPASRIRTCSEAIDSQALPERDKRGPHSTRACA